MQKLMVFIQKKPALNTQQFHAALQHYLSAMQNSFSYIRYALVDDDVAPAQALAMTGSKHPRDAVLSFYASDAFDMTKIEHQLQPVAEQICSYRVEEREPLHYDAAAGRVPGMCQIALLKKPPHLTREQWLDIWLNSHTQIAIDTQSTFSYRQNIVQSIVSADDWPAYDAIVEEQFPAAAMTNRALFFNAEHNEQLYRANEKSMIESCMRFVDFNAFECVQMSEYRLK
jgi:hypothetical protein